MLFRLLSIYSQFLSHLIHVEHFFRAFLLTLTIYYYSIEHTSIYLYTNVFIMLHTYEDLVTYCFGIRF